MEGSPDVADRDRIERAGISAQSAETPAMALASVMADLGFDFGDPVSTEHEVMQFYADPANNPFVQAQLEARIALDAGIMEAVAQSVKHHREAILRDDRFGPLRNSSLDDLVGTFATALTFGLAKFGAVEFNNAFEDAVKPILFEEPTKKD